MFIPSCTSLCSFQLLTSCSSPPFVKYLAPGTKYSSLHPKQGTLTPVCMTNAMTSQSPDFLPSSDSHLYCPFYVLPQGYTLCLVITHKLFCSPTTGDRLYGLFLPPSSLFLSFIQSSPCSPLSLCSSLSLHFSHLLMDFHCWRPPVF